MKKEVKELVILLVIIVCVLGGSYLLMADHDDIIRKTKVEDEVTEEIGLDETSSSGGGDIIDIEEVEEELLESVTGLVIGLDAAGGLTDVLMAVNLNTETNKVKLVSVPRDLEIDFLNEPFKSMRSEFNEKVSSGEIEANKHQRSYSLINSVYLDTGRTTDGLYLTKDIVEEITGLQIDYLAVIDVYGFKDIIDAIGGVDFDVPRDMYYKDPAQDLLIDLKKGFQHLDGEHAMQLVRFRRYPTGDIQRIAVQQDFMMALYQKIAGVRDVSTILSTVEAAYNIAETDFGLTTALEYSEYMFNLNVSDLMSPETMITIPSWGYKEEYVNDEGEDKYRYHQYWDPEEARQVVEDLLNN